ncbi:MAG TPA: hypothetical protein VMK66_16525 [Myxococcales bacterium]|nr:hypothetical protein [Myxococcales bacterium]
MRHKLAFVAAAIVLPGGFLALLGVILVRALSQTARGRKVVALAQRRVAVLRGASLGWLGERQAA